MRVLVVRTGDAEGLRVKGRLGNQAVGKRQAEDAGNARGDAQQEQVPVKAGGFAQRELAPLGNQRGHVVVEPEQNGQQHGKGQREKDVSGAEVPEADEPGARGERRLKGDARGQHGQGHVGHAANVHEAGEEYQGQGRPVVVEKGPNLPPEEAALANHATGVGGHEDEQRGHDGQIERRAATETIEHLDALLHIDAGHIEAKDVAGKPRHPPQAVARVENGEGNV